MINLYINTPILRWFEQNVGSISQGFYGLNNNKYVERLREWGYAGDYLQTKYTNKSSDINWLAANKSEI